MASKKNSNLFEAKKKKDDEFYTFYEDIKAEVSHYKDDFKHKIVYCNCDRPYESEFFMFFYEHFYDYKLKKLICTGYNKTGRGFYAEVTADGEYNTMLVGDGDFRSEECKRYLNECDIVVTNCPFSLFNEYMELLDKENKKFLIVGKENGLCSSSFFNMFKEGRVKKGYEKIKYFFDANFEVKTFGNTCWYTNLDVKKNAKKIHLSKKYYKEDGITPLNDLEYPKFYNYDAINVNKIVDIPVDYKEIMGVPISFVDYCVGEYSSDNEISGNLLKYYEIIGIYTRSEAERMGFREIGEEWCDIYYASGGKAHMSPKMHNPVLLINGNPKMVYQRIFIKRK